MKASLLNFAVTDGSSVVVTRYNNITPENAASLYFSSGTNFECQEPGLYQMVKTDKCEQTVIISSGIKLLFFPFYLSN